MDICVEVKMFKSWSNPAQNSVWMLTLFSLIVWKADSIHSKQLSTEQQKNWPGMSPLAFTSPDPDDRGGVGKQGRIYPTQSETDGVVLQNEPGATFKSLFQTGNKIHFRRAHFCYKNLCFLAFPLPFWKPIFRYYPLRSCTPVSFTITVFCVDTVSFLMEVLWSHKTACYFSTENQGIFCKQNKKPSSGPD